VFEAVNGHRLSWIVLWKRSRDLTRRLRPVKRSAARRRRPQAAGTGSPGVLDEEKSGLSASTQLLHHSCTGFPHGA
jgi:hypothetical protein